MLRLLILIMSIIALMSGDAKEISVNKVKYAGPISIPSAIEIGKPWPGEREDILDTHINIDQLSLKEIDLSLEKFDSCENNTLHILLFGIENRNFVNAKLSIEGAEKYKVYLDEKKIDDLNISLSPATHKVIVTISEFTPLSDLKISLISDNVDEIKITSDRYRILTLDDILYGTRITNATMSPSGKHIIESLEDIDKEGKIKSWQILYNLKENTSRVINETSYWLPKSDIIYTIRENHEFRRHLVKIDPLTGNEEVWLTNIPDGKFEVSPNGKFLIYSLERKGQKEDIDAYQILEPDDRQPGWRNRTYPAIYKDGILLPLTDGADNVRMLGISDDDNKMLIISSHSRLKQRPTNVSSLYLIDLPSMSIDTIIEEDGFLKTAILSPSGKKVVAAGSPEAFNRIGCILPNDVTPSMSQNELFLIDVDTKEIKPLTRSFHPNPQSLNWGKEEDIYFRAENQDKYSIYHLNLKNGNIDEVEIPENAIKGFSVSKNSDMMAIWGQSDSNPDHLYSYDIRKRTWTMLDNPSSSRLENVKIGKCEDWNFKNERGDTIFGRFYLPDNFDPNKKYPLIVNYYGGCSPSQRAFESRYPHHLYAAQEYIVYVIQPSGATGFGQEFSSRHVSTAGKGVAEDIIEGTQKFVNDHPYVDRKKIGCIGASYGGFMTMYLQTLTDIFAAAISHAGISDHTSYWGEGYWGYSYSEVSMGNHKPWTDPELFVKQSPLFNADKITTPILFLHGDGDTNVPPGESIQMFTALKLLDRETALVEIADQNHHILDPKKRKKWNDTIFAWFAKYLKNDSTWWDNLYPAKDY